MLMVVIVILVMMIVIIVLVGSIMVVCFINGSKNINGSSSSDISSIKINERSSNKWYYC